MSATAGISRLRTVQTPAWLTGPIVPAAIAAVLGLIGLGDKSFWLDEAFSAITSRQGLTSLVGYLWRSELYGAPYYLMLHEWMHFGMGEAALRLLSVVISVIGVIATYYVAKRYQVGFQAALLLAISPFFVQWEQSAKEYALLAAWASISTLAYLRYRERPTHIRTLVYAASAIAMMYIHPDGAFVIVAHAIWTWLETPAGHRVRRLALYVPIVVLWLPMVAFLLTHRDKISWIEPLSGATMSDAFIGLLGGAAAAAAIVVLLVVAVVRRPRLDLPWLWLAMPIAGVLLLSAFVQPMLQARYVIVVLPALAIILGRFRPVVLAVLGIVLAVGVASWYTQPAREDWRAATAWLHSAVEPGDGVYYSPSYAELPVRYYGEVGQPLPTNGPYENDRIWLIERPDSLTAPIPVTSFGPYDAAESRTYGWSGPRVTLLVRH
jgi:mannosyltransferase